jgi:hypothetical protein
MVRCASAETTPPLRANNFRREVGDGWMSCVNDTSRPLPPACFLALSSAQSVPYGVGIGSVLDNILSHAGWKETLGCDWGR